MKPGGQKTHRRAISFSILVIGLAIGFFIGLVFSQFSKLDKQAFDLRWELEKLVTKEPTFELLKEGVDIIDKNYVDIDKVDKTDLVYGAMRGMIGALEDPYSVFFEPQDSKIFEENVNGSFGGIGAEIGIRNEVVTIISPLKDSPAEKAGLRAGDKVLSVDDTSTEGLSIDGAVKIIRGPKGSEVVLGITRDENEDVIQISIIRDTIRIPIIDWEDKDDGIAYIALYHFTETAVGDFGDVVNEILKSDTEKIILDLRNNPGGFLEVAVNIAGWFLEKGQIVLKEDSGGNNISKVHRANGSGSLKDYPIVVLINGGSASASEIFAGALRDHKGTILIGEKSFGKGSVQELLKLSDGSSMKVTVAKWLTPSGLSIDGNGLEPDVTVEMTQEIFDNEGDVQLEKAVEVIKNL